MLSDEFFGQDITYSFTSIYFYLLIKYRLIDAVPARMYRIGIVFELDIKRLSDSQNML